MSTTRKTPKLRFPEFTDDWEQRKFSDVVEIGSGKDYKNLGLGDIPVYGTGGYMLSVDQSLSKDRDAIGIGRKGTIDKPFIIRAPFWTVDTLFYCIPKNKQNLQFTYCLFQNVDWKTYDESTGVPSLSKSTINNVTTKLPNLEEQQKIGELFNKLDTTITLHQRELDSLKKLKKSLLQKMFPKNGEKIPELRFPEFTGDWEQRKLFDIADFKSGQGLSLSDISKEGTQECILYGNLYTDYGMIITSVLKSTNAIPSNPVYSKNGDVLVPASDTTPTGLARASCLEKSGVLLGGDINIIRPRQGINGSCLSLAINHNKRQLIRLIKGTTVKHIHNSDLSTVVVALPKNLDEQREIVNTFKNLDNHITLHQRELDSLKKLKKGLLQNMFV